MLSKVCLRVHELSDFVIHDFLALWVLDSLLDNTKDVDMVYRRRHSVLRILIACIDYSLIQERLDVFINVGIFKLHFQVEAPKNKQVIDDVIMNDANDDGDDHDPSKNLEDPKTDEESEKDADANPKHDDVIHHKGETRNS